MTWPHTIKPIFLHILVAKSTRAGRSLGKAVSTIIWGLGEKKQELSEENKAKETASVLSDMFIYDAPNNTTDFV